MTVTDVARVGSARQVADDEWLAGAAEEPAVADDGGRGHGQRRAVRPQQRPGYVLKTRKPLRGQAWPFILLTGGEFSGKTYTLAAAAASGRFGRVWALPFGEDPDQYAELMPDAEIVEHDGSLYQFAAAIEQVGKIVNEEPLVDGKPQLVLVDSGSVLWDLFTQIAEGKAKKTDEAVSDLMRNPYANVNIGPLIWSDVNKMWLRLVRQLKNMRAVVVMTARGKDGVVVAANGKIDNDAARQGRRTYRVAVQSETPYEASAFVRLDREQPPQVLGVRVGRHGLRPGLDQPMICDGKPHDRGGRQHTFPEFSLQWLVFDLMKFDPGSAYDRQVTDPNPSPGQGDAETVQEVKIDGAHEAPGQPAVAETMPAGGR